MNYLPKLKDLTEAFSFFLEQYEYKLVRAEDTHTMGCMYLQYEKNDAPTVKIEMEKYVVEVLIQVKDDFYPLKHIYKYLNPKEILRDNQAYRKKKVFKNFLKKDYMLYYDHFITNKQVFDLQKYLEFFKNYPWWVWKWKNK